MRTPIFCSFLTTVLLSLTTFGSEPLPIDEPNNKRKVTFATEGEDATSAFYYFFYGLPGDEVSKVRMLSNGGSQNKPSITDYYLEGTFIWIIERSAERRDLPSLTKGKNAPFQTTSERVIKTVPVERLPLYSFPDAPEIPRLSEAERQELTTIISFLTKSREPVQKH